MDTDSMTLHKTYISSFYSLVPDTVSTTPNSIHYLTALQFQKCKYFTQACA